MPRRRPVPRRRRASRVPSRAGARAMAMPVSAASLSRRQFLAGAGALAAGAALLPRLGRAQGREDRKPGAGGEVEILGPGTVQITLTINGENRALKVEPRTTLLAALRDRCGLTGAKEICDRGECGGCTVLLNDLSVYSCMMLAVAADGQQVRTVEGLAKGDALHPVQQAFVECDGLQCGFCTPGQVMSAVACCEKVKDPKPEDIRRAMAGNLCRCGATPKILEAVGAAAKRMKKG